jgi:hypothetical protein
VIIGINGATRTPEFNNVGRMPSRIIGIDTWLLIRIGPGCPAPAKRLADYGWG